MVSARPGVVIGEKGRRNGAQFRGRIRDASREAEIRQLRGFLAEMQQNLAAAQKRLDALLGAGHERITVTFIENDLPLAALPMETGGMPFSPKALPARGTPERIEETGRTVEPKRIEELKCAAEPVHAEEAAHTAENAPYEKWLWSWALIKKIARRAEGQDFSSERVEDFARNVVLNESDLDMLEMRMHAESDWKALGAFLESLYDFAEMEAIPAVALPALRGAIRECRHINLKIDGIDFDIYALNAAMAVAKMVMAGEVDIGDTRIDADGQYLSEWIARASGAAIPETMEIGFGAEDAPVRVGRGRFARAAAIGASVLGLAAASFAGWMLLRPVPGSDAEMPNGQNAAVSAEPSVVASAAGTSPSAAAQQPEAKSKAAEEVPGKADAAPEGTSAPAEKPGKKAKAAHSAHKGKGPGEKPVPHPHKKKAGHNQALQAKPAGIDLDEW